MTDDARKEVLSRLRRSGEASPVKGLPISKPQRKWLVSLLDTRVMNKQVRDTCMAELETMTSERASTWIGELRRLPRRHGRLI
jgi:hypothetical protein